jgi:hypothetical protein
VGIGGTGTIGVDQQESSQRTVNKKRVRQPKGRSPYLLDAPTPPHREMMMEMSSSDNS